MRTRPIRTFPHDDKENCLFSEDVVSFARDNGFYTGSDEDFSFADVYNPIGFEGARFYEMRVWSFFRSVVGADVMDQYTDFVEGKDYTKRMEWSYKPAQKLGVRRVMELLKDHLEGTKFDFTQDIGAGPFNMPYRWHTIEGLTFTVDGKNYVNERPTSTQQTGFVFVAQSRADVPDSMTVSNWFGVDDAACTVFAPMYGSNTEVLLALADKDNGDIMHVTLSSSFWVFNLVANLAYTRWNLIYPEVKSMADKLQDAYLANSTAAEEKAKTMEHDEAVAYLTQFSKEAGQAIHDAWLDFWEFLVPRFLDGDLKTYVPGAQNPEVEYPGYGPNVDGPWYKRIVEDTGDRYLIPEEPHTSSEAHSSSSNAPEHGWATWKTVLIAIAGFFVVAVIITVAVIIVRKRRGAMSGYTSIDT